jgi:hypothetical protein
MLGRTILGYCRPFVSNTSSPDSSRLTFAVAVVYVLRGFLYVANIGALTAVAVSLLMVGGSLALAWFVLPPFLGRWGLIAYLLVTVLVFVSGPMFGAIGFLRAAIPWVGATAISLATALYVTVVYPAIPQELGGVKPRCARLEVKRGELSASAQRELVDPSSEDTVVRTLPVSLLFTANDFYIVRARGTEPGSTYRIGSGTVLSTVGC